MRSATPQADTVEQPVQLVDRQFDGLVADIGLGLEALGLQAFEPRAGAIALPVEDLDPLLVRLRNTNSTGLNTSTLMSSATSAARPLMDLRKSTGFG